MFKRLLSQSGSSKGKGQPKAIKKEEQEVNEEGPDVRTPATVPLRYDDGEENEAVQLQQSPRPSVEEEAEQEEEGDGDGQQPLSSSSLDAQALYADNFLLRREQARQRNELAEKRYREAQITAALEDANEERARLEEQVIGFVTALHERDVEIRRLKEEKAEMEEVLRAVAEYHANQEEDQAAPGPAEEEKTGAGRESGSRLYRLLVLTAPGVGLLLLLLLLTAAIPSVDHRLLGGLGGLLLLPSSPLWRNRASALTHLAPGHGVLRQGEYLRGCGGQQRSSMIGGWGGAWCEDPHVLHLEAGGNLVLYKGYSPFNHAGPVWTSGALTSYRIGLGGRNNGNGKGGGKDGGNFHALVSVNGVLKVVRVDEGKRKEAVVFSRPVSRLPAGLLGLEMVKRK